MKTIIAIPCMETMPYQFVQSLVSLEHIGETNICFLSGSLVYDARNMLAAQAVSAESDYVLWVDSDMVFDSTMLKMLAEDINEGRDIVSGICFRRKPPFIPPIWKDIEKKEVYLDYPKNDIFEVDACGFGCVLMRTEVLKAMNDAFVKPFNPFQDYGEDIAFCLRAKDLGYKIYCDSRVKLGHVGTAIINEDFFEGWYQNVRANNS